MQADDLRGPRRPILSAILVAVVAVIFLAVAAATFLLWPEPGGVTQQADASSPVGEIVTAQVVSVGEVPCFAVEYDPNAGSGSDEPSCLEVRAALESGKQVTFTLDQLQSEINSFQEGDRVKLVENVPATGDELADEVEAEPFYTFYEHPRGAQMVLLVILFVIIVVAVGRLRGALALVGVGAAILLLIVFVLPAILAGKPPVLVASVGSIGIMLIVLYLAHGFSHRTTAALFGSIFGISFTAIAGLGVTRWLHFTGIGSVEDSSLLIAVPGLQMNDVLTATIVIAGLGILNDITVAQASAVWEMRALNPQLPKRRIFQSAMRVGRDHIASSIYTLVFAYAGAMLVVLLLLYTHPRDLIELVTSEQIAQEVVRTLVGAAGLVLSMPVTTAFAVMFAKERQL